MRVGLLFDYGFDARAHAALAAGGYGFDRAGFDLFSFPGNLALAAFDLDRFARAQARRARRRGWRGVVSHDEQFGAVAAALAAQYAGLPGPTPESVVACQHKLHMRRVLDRVQPEVNPRYAALQCRYGEPVPEGLDYPCFVRPVKAAFSVLARRVRSRDELQAHLRFGPGEGWLIRRLVEPFERVARQRLPGAGSAHCMLVEEPLATPQYNLDGYVHDGELRVLGVVDAVMYPGTQSFQRWQLPSRLPPPVVDRAAAVAGRFLAAVGFRHGFFNMEFFHDAAADRFTVIEFNPRLASQFGDLYRRVLGVDPHAMALALATGGDPRQVRRAAPTAGVAASLVWRVFDAASLPAAPGAARRSALAREIPDADLTTYRSSAAILRRDFKWLDSHRYGIVNLGAPDWNTMRQRGARIAALLGWPDAPYAEVLPAAAGNGFAAALGAAE